MFSDERRSTFEWIVVPAFIVILGTLLYVPTLKSGFFLDDYRYKSILDGRIPGIAWWDLFNYKYDGNMGGPWWSGSEVKCRLFRPLSSASIALDHLLFQGSAFGYHLTSLVLFALFLILAHRLYLNLSGSVSAANWGIGFLAVHPANMIAVSWIATRNDQLVGIFLISTILALDRYRRTARKSSLLLSYISFVAALMSKESGLATTGVVVLYSFFLDPSLQKMTWQERFRILLRSGRMWMFIVLGIGFLIFYPLAGFGANVKLYQTPFSDPISYLKNAVVQYPGLILKIFRLIPPLKYGPLFHLITIISPVILVGMICVLIWKERRVTFFFGGWVVVTLLIEASGVQQFGGSFTYRNIVPATIGACFLMGSLITNLWRLQSSKSVLRVARVAALIFVFVSGIVGAAYITNLNLRAYGMSVQLIRDALIHADVERNPKGPRSAFLLNCPVSALELFPSEVWRNETGENLTWFEPLYCSKEPVTVHRNSERSITIRVDGGIIDRTIGEGFLVQNKPMVEGREWIGPRFTVAAREVRRGRLIAAEFTFPQSVDEPDLRFLTWNDGRFTRIKLPEVGEEIVIPKVEVFVR